MKYIATARQFCGGAIRKKPLGAVQLPFNRLVLVLFVSGVQNSAMGCIPVHFLI